ncbi:hypothetical protein HPB51_029671 [Rhipicephalus microplus]|uniref:Uncharacterized protein n=1 Tax=Rhipicephalus microplus TaxID=6941 RepID=A0A9J6CTX3_RHIMP|nr:hypothetical protein HPB51_029671 [Rhipicephalus microplus]
MRVEVGGCEILLDEFTRLRGGKTAGERFRLKGADKPSLNPVLRIPANEANEDVVCLNVQQNIVVVSTSKIEYADRYAAVGTIDIRGMAHKISTDEATPRGTVKVVIRGISLEDTAQEISDNVVHKHNPMALQAN